MSMSDNTIAGLANPKPILKQQKSALVTTNPLIKNSSQDTVQVTSDTNEMFSRMGIADKSLRDINTNVSDSVIGFMDDLFNKPHDVPWRHYTFLILKRDNRYSYFGVLFIFIAIFILLTG